MQKLSRVFDETKTWSQKKELHCLSFGCSNRSKPQDQKTLSKFTDAFYKKPAHLDALPAFTLNYKKGSQMISESKGKAPP
mmetsp:Transcript_29141/g.43913  ORF Transcript_29141/g.43913 Transcript_29141/m.43913 type:complete len:80 (-) Transcript_29141:473-712(-)